jgi:hypothetical protein
VADYIFLMHDDEIEPVAAPAWGDYLGKLGARLQGGSAIGEGVCVRKAGPAPSITGHLGGYIRVTADSLADARSLLPGNPVFEAGGTVEIRELPRTD